MVESRRAASGTMTRMQKVLAVGGLNVLVNNADIAGPNAPVEEVSPQRGRTAHPFIGKSPCLGKGSHVSQPTVPAKVSGGASFGRMRGFRSEVHQAVTCHVAVPAGLHRQIEDRLEMRPQGLAALRFVARMPNGILGFFDDWFSDQHSMHCN